MLIPGCQLLASIFGRYLRNLPCLGCNDIRPLFPNRRQPIFRAVVVVATSMNDSSALIEEFGYCFEEPHTGFLDEQEMT